MAINNTPRSFQYWNAIVATPPDFNLDAGSYGLTIAWTAGSATLQKMLPDGVTYVPVTAAIAASGYTRVGLPAGQYRLVIVTGPLTGEIALISPGRVGGS